MIILELHTTTTTDHEFFIATTCYSNLLISASDYSSVLIVDYYPLIITSSWYCNCNDDYFSKNITVASITIDYYWSLLMILTDKY